jgi:hypothetical protein
MAGMMTEADIDRRIDRMNGLLATAFGLRRGTLATRLRKAGRRVPAGLRERMIAIEEARAIVGHPRLSAMIDEAEFDRTCAQAEEVLGAVDRADARRGAILGMLGALAFNLILLAAILLAILRWRGLV